MGDSQPYHKPEEWYDGHPLNDKTQQGVIATGLGLDKDAFEGLKEEVLNQLDQMWPARTPLKGYRTHQLKQRITKYVLDNWPQIRDARAPKDWRDRAALAIVKIANSIDRKRVKGSQDRPVAATPTAGLKREGSPSSPSATAPIKRNRSETGGTPRPVDGLPWVVLMKGEQPHLSGAMEELLCDEYGVISFKSLLAAFKQPDSGGFEYSTTTSGARFPIIDDETLRFVLRRAGGEEMTIVSQAKPLTGFNPSSNDYRSPLPSLQQGPMPGDPTTYGSLGHPPSSLITIARRPSTPLPSAPTGGGIKPNEPSAADTHGKAGGEDESPNDGPKPLEADKLKETNEGGSTNKPAAVGEHPAIEKPDSMMPDAPAPEPMAKRGETSEGDSTNKPAAEESSDDDLDDGRENPSDGDESRDEGSDYDPKYPSDEEESSDEDLDEDPDDNPEYPPDEEESSDEDLDEDPDDNPEYPPAGEERTKTETLDITKPGTLNPDVEAKLLAFANTVNEDEEEAVDSVGNTLTQIGRELNDQLGEKLARQTIASMNFTCALLKVGLPQMLQSDRIQLPGSWGLNPTARLSPAQLHALAESIKQDHEVGGGAELSKPGTGKTHLAYLRAAFYIRLAIQRRQIEEDRRAHRTGRHLISDDQREGECCPTEAEQPFPCSCVKGNYTHCLQIPNGASLVVVPAGIVAHHARAIQMIFEGGTLENNEIIPLHIRILNSSAVSVLKKDDKFNQRYLHPLTRADKEALCRVLPPAPTRPSRVRVVDWKVSNDYLRNCGRSKGGDQGGASSLANGYIIVTSRESLPTQLAEPFTCTVTETPKAKGGTKGEKDKAPVPVEREKHCALVLRDVTVDEAHNVFRLDSNQMKWFFWYRTQLHGATGHQPFYWVLSGTMRSAGITPFANHMANMLATRAWADESTLPANQRHLKHLYYDGNQSESPLSELVGQHAKLISMQQDCSYEKMDGASRADFEKLLIEHATISSKLYETLAIERTHDTLNIVGKPLMETHKIKRKNFHHSIAYGNDEVGILGELKMQVEQERNKKHQESLIAWKRQGKAGPEPQPVSLRFLSNYNFLVVASTCPALVGWFTREGRAKHQLKGLTVDQPFIKRCFQDPLRSVFYTNSLEWRKGDKKWELLEQLLLEKLAKPKSSNKKPSKVLVTLRKPVVSLAYLCHIVRLLEAEADFTASDPRKRRVLFIHADVSPIDRLAYFDAINDHDSETRVLVANIEMVAEGFAITGVNHVIIVDPFPDINKLEQVADRPRRIGQSETKYNVHSFYNETSDVDLRILAAVRTSNLVSDAVDATNKQGSGKGGAVEGSGKGGAVEGSGKAVVIEVSDDEDTTKQNGEGNVHNSKRSAARARKDYV